VPQTKTKSPTITKHNQYFTMSHHNTNHGDLNGQYSRYLFRGSSKCSSFAQQQRGYGYATYSFDKTTLTPPSHSCKYHIFCNFCNCQTSRITNSMNVVHYWGSEHSDPSLSRTAVTLARRETVHSYTSVAVMMTYLNTSSISFYLVFYFV
jgi:hypothetical protein